MPLLKIKTAIPLPDFERARRIRIPAMPCLNTAKNQGLIATIAI